MGKEQGNGAENSDRKKRGMNGPSLPTFFHSLSPLSERLEQARKSGVFELTKFEIARFNCSINQALQ